MRLLSVLCFICLSVAAANAVADESASRKAGRYVNVAPAATPVQEDLLSVVIDVSFGPGISTVDDALKHILLRSGFRLASLKASDPYMPVLLSRPLPQVHRHLGPIMLRDALATLAGTPWSLSVDPVNRLISYELLAEFRPVSDAVTPSNATQ